MTRPLRVLDLFAGTGVGVACKRLGFREMGVEIMPEAIATRAANGMATIYHDVWEGLVGKLFVPPYDVLWASPPCQTFSLAGNGAGRRALDEVMEAVRMEAWKDPQLLLDFGEKHDMRTALVLTPLAHIWRDRPRFVALEQVPTVLPVWEAYAVEMRKMGYSVQVANLHAEQYGVPQTRKRAILVARLDGPVALPMPTHSKYYPRDPKRLDEGVLPWVSMAEALGWGMTARPYLTVTGGGDPDSSKHMGDVAPSLLGSKASRERVASERAAGRFAYPDEPGRQGRRTCGELKLLASEAAALQSYPDGRSEYEATHPDGRVEQLRRTTAHFTQNNRQAHQSKRTMDQPAPTVTAGHDSTNRGFIDHDGQLTMATPDEVAALQSYPTSLLSTYSTNSDYQNRGERMVEQPAPTVTSKAGRNKWDGGRNLEPAEAATLQSYPVFRHGNQAHAAKRTADQPAPTLHFGQRSNKVEWMDPADVDDTAASGQRVTTDEASTLQTYPGEPPFIWCGKRSKVFLQIGNAVPPLLAQHILAALTRDAD